AGLAAPGPARASAQPAPAPATWLRVLDPVARRYVGALPLKFLNFLAVPAGTGLFHLWPRLRWPRPKSRQPLVRGSGYTGRWQASPRESPAITWEFDPPTASGKWWSRGTASGVIDLANADADAALPWERMLSKSLGPGAAGRVSWYRRMEVSIRLRDLMPSLLFEEGGVRFFAPDQWQNLLPAAERRPGNMTCYAIGQATSTSAGPRLGIGGDASGGAPEMMGSAEFKRLESELIVLQALPVADESELFAGDDLPEKLELAVDLINAGASPVVLIVPAIPAALADDVARVIKQHAAKGASIGYTLVKTIRRRQRKEFLPDPRALRKKLRKILAPHVPPALLDDLVLFVNEEARHDRRD
ncbi:MAG: hypothetical protein ACRDN0_31155, partial [Trebonia sp.]